MRDLIGSFGWECRFRSVTILVFFDGAIMAQSVAELCVEKGLTVAQLAERSQLEEGRVLAIAMGRWTPSPSERQKVAAVFGVAIADIAWGHKTPIQHLYGHGPG